MESGDSGAAVRLGELGFDWTSADLVQQWVRGRERAFLISPGLHPRSVLEPEHVLAGLFVVATSDVRDSRVNAVLKPDLLIERYLKTTWPRCCWFHDGLPDVFIQVNHRWNAAPVYLLNGPVANWTVAPRRIPRYFRGTSKA